MATYHSPSVNKPGLLAGLTRNQLIFIAVVLAATILIAAGTIWLAPEGMPVE